MAFIVETQCTRHFTVPGSIQDNFPFFCNFETHIPHHFYGLKELNRLDGGVYQWRFAKLSFSGIDFQIEFKTRFEITEQKKIEIIPIQGSQKTQLSGFWKFSDEGANTQVQFEVLLVGEVPLPQLTKSFVAPLMQTEIKKLFDRYIENVKKTLATK